MSDRPRVSVIVPFFDSERTLAACVESLLVQEDVGGSYEILLVDNGSTDASAEIARQSPGVRLLEEPTRGAYAARNTGLRHATAPVLAFTDADCVVDRDWLAAVLDGFGDPRTAVLLGHCRYPDDASRWLHLLGTYENAKTRYVIDRCEPAHHFAYCNNMAVRASVFDELGPFLEWQRAADSELVHRLAARRPDLTLTFHPAMRVTHLEFVRGRNRARRLRLYQTTNAQIPTFRELSLRQRLGVLARWFRGSKG